MSTTADAMSICTIMRLVPSHIDADPHPAGISREPRTKLGLGGFDPGSVRFGRACRRRLETEDRSANAGARLGSKSPEARYEQGALP